MGEIEVVSVAVAMAIGVVWTVVMLGRQGYGSLVGVGRSAWSEAVRIVAGELGLEHRPLPEAFDMADGDIGRTRIDIGYDTIDDYDGLVMKIEVFAGSIPETLVVRRPTAKLDEGIVLGGKQSSGDAALDARIEIYGAPSPWLDAIARDASLRALLAKSVGDLGATIVDRHLLLLDKKFCEDPACLRERVHALLDTARRLENPAAKVAPVATAKEGAARIRRAKAMDGDAKIDALRAYFDSIAPSLGRAKVFRKPGEEAFDLRGTYRGRPVRLEIDSSLGIEITVRTSGAPTLFFNFSPELRASDEVAPAWGGGNAERKHFVGEQVYLEGSKRELRRKVEQFESMPADARRAIADRMPELGVRYVRIESRDVWLMTWTALDEMSDPEAELGELIAFAGRIAESFGPPAEEDEDEDAEEDEDEDEDAEEDDEA